MDAHRRFIDRDLAIDAHGEEIVRAQAIRAALQLPMRVDDLELVVGASVGCATVGGGSGRAGTTFERADQALYSAKTTGMIAVAGDPMIDAVARVDVLPVSLSSSDA